MTAEEQPPDRSSRFRVYGSPVPQSGTRIVPTAVGPRGISTGGVGLEAWRQSVANEASIQWVDGRRHLGPVAVEIEFRFPMPASRLVRQKNAGSIPKTTQPDLDKLLRAVFDSLRQGGLLLDDAQITEVHASKVEWHESWYGAEIVVRDLWTP